MVIILMFLKHWKHLIPKTQSLQLINKLDKEIIASLDYKSIEFHVSKKRYSNIETKNNNNVNVLELNINIVINVFKN